MAKIIYAKYTLNLSKKKKKTTTLITERKILMWIVYLSKSILQIISRVIQILYHFFPYENYGVPTILTIINYMPNVSILQKKNEYYLFYYKKIIKFIIFLSLHFTKYVAYHEWQPLFNVEATDWQYITSATPNCSWAVGDF